MKNIFLAFFLIFTFANNALAESFYFKKCDFSENYISNYTFDFDNKIINVLFISKKDESTQEWIDKIERVTKHQVASEKIQSKSGKDIYFQYYLDGKTKTVSRQNYKKKGDFFDIYGPPMKTYCEEVSANWDKSEDEIKPEDKQKKLEREKEKKRIEKKKKQEELTRKEEERRKKLKEEQKEIEKTETHEILVVAKKWIKLSKYKEDSAKSLEKDFDEKAKEICLNKNFKILKKKVEIIDIDETPAFGTETVIKLGIKGIVECK